MALELIQIMDKKELRKAVERIAKAVEALPPEKRQYILGYADGVVAGERKPEANK